MKLITNIASPFARKVRVVAEEAGLAGAVEIIEVTTNPTAVDSDLVRLNPLGKLPTLLRQEGRPIYDSRTICRMLDDQSGAGLYPPKPLLWEYLTLESTADGIMDAAVLMVYENRCRPKEHRSCDWVDAQWEKASRALDTIEEDWMEHLASELNIGQIAVGCALGYLDFRHSDRNWRDGRHKLASWFNVFSRRPSMVNSAPQ